MFARTIAARIHLFIRTVTAIRSSRGPFASAGIGSVAFSRSIAESLLPFHSSYRLLTRFETQLVLQAA
jgi:hypothetical protein